MRKNKKALIKEIIEWIAIILSIISAIITLTKG